LEQLERLQKIQRTKDLLSCQHPWAAGQKAAGQKELQKAAGQKKVQRAAGQKKVQRAAAAAAAGQKKVQRAAVCATGLNVDKHLYHLNLDTEMASVATTSGMSKNVFLMRIN
jgi:hypothetical protein